MRKDLYRAIVIIEASEGLKRYKIIEDALLMYLDSRGRHALGGFRILTVSEDLYRELVSIGNGSAEAGLRRLLEAFHTHQLVGAKHPSSVPGSGSGTVSSAVSGGVTGECWA